MLYIASFNKSIKNSGIKSNYDVKICIAISWLLTRLLQRVKRNLKFCSKNLPFDARVNSR